MAINLDQVLALQTRGLLHTFESFTMSVNLYGKNDVDHKKPLEDLGEESTISALMENAPVAVVGSLRPVQIQQVQGKTIFCTSGRERFQCGADFLHDRDSAREELQGITGWYVSTIQQRVKETLSLVKSVPTPIGPNLVSSLNEFLDLVQGNPNAICEAQLHEPQMPTARRASSPSM